MMNEAAATERVKTHLAMVARSFQHWMGRELLPGVPVGPALAAGIFGAPFVLVSHGTEPDPILNYGNQVALNLWEMTWEELTSTPSRLTAEAPNREERARLLARVTRDGFIDNYSGVRISKSGRRFRIDQAIVWNLLTAAGEAAGQAARFERWELL
jgi:hypothetical protein